VSGRTESLWELNALSFGFQPEGQFVVPMLYTQPDDNGRGPSRFLGKGL
jgi:hypothetical protein